MKETVILLSESGKELGEHDKLDAHRKGLYHSAFSVFLFNDKGEWLLQKRAKTKYHSAGLWTNTCCSHPGKGDPLPFAYERLAYEMGISDVHLKFMFSFQYFADLGELKEHEFDHVFFGRTNKIPNPNPKEVDDFKFIDFQTLEAQINKNPETFTEWFKIIYKKVFELVKKY